MKQNQIQFKKMLIQISFEKGNLVEDLVLREGEVTGT